MWFLPLHIGAEVIIGMGIFNKAAGIFGILSIFTGHPISAVEWVMNILQMMLLPVFVMAFLDIRKKDALRMLAFAHIYILDSFMTLGFTIYFIVHWFTAGARAANATAAKASASASVAATTETVAAEAQTTVAAWPVATPMPEIYKRAADAAATAASTAAAASASGVNQSATVAQETAVSIVLTVAVLIVRLYFTLVIVGYARQLVKLHNLRSDNGFPTGSRAARIQYWLIRPMERFWTGHSARPTGSYMDEATQRLTPR